MADAPRALYRSGHIYILFSALLHTLLGAYVTARPAPAHGWLAAGPAGTFAPT